MHYYSTYDLIVESEFQLPELPTVEPETATIDVAIRSAEVEPVPDSEGGTGRRRIQAEPGICRLSYDSIGSFLIKNGAQILFDPDHDGIIEKKITRRLIESEILGVLCHQRGLLVLHASAVSVDGKGAVFLGDRGAGKSTTAAAFYTGGNGLFEDDVVGIRFDHEGPVVLPGVPQLRLDPQAAEALGITDTVRYEDDWGPNKCYHATGNAPAPAPLAGCYILQEDEGLTIEQCTGQEAFVSLVSQTYAHGLLADTQTERDHFQQCSEIVETAQIRRIKRPKNFERIPELIEQVTEDVKTC
ncbi:hypothetical protein SAMN05216388_104517 [Halorientalis persicus]|uniref:Hpr(Ser) kinase/phosphatase n=1 Tax=Halorientalis persicus TaxID=1367881 RepID=A0A1H8W0I1_9EURY|nr:hypothetical protein [Halorientalis persicus]SEP21094.1 hypothetical protein SAMN05216388_104517 [Halorientalis persicus]